MQHILRRLWASALSRTPGPDEDGVATPVLDVQAYEASVGSPRPSIVTLMRYSRAWRSLRRPLQSHLPQPRRAGAHGQYSRRVTRLADVARVANVPVEEVGAIVDAFREPDLNLLAAPA